MYKKQVFNRKTVVSGLGSYSRMPAFLVVAVLAGFLALAAFHAAGTLHAEDNPILAPAAGLLSDDGDAAPNLVSEIGFNGVSVFHIPLAASDAAGNLTLAPAVSPFGDDGDANPGDINVNNNGVPTNDSPALDYAAGTAYVATLEVLDALPSPFISAAISGPAAFQSPFADPAPESVSPFGGVNQSPSFSGGASQTRSIAENSPAGTNVGSPVSASDPDGDTLTYTFGGTDAGKFDFNSSNQQISLKSGTTLDYETKTSYSVYVNADDGFDNVTATVTINVTDVTAPGKPTISASQNSTTPSSKIDVTLTPGNGSADKYQVIWTHDKNSWNIPHKEITATTATIDSLTANTTYYIKARSYNVEGWSAWSDEASQTTAQGNRAPTFPAATATRSIAEHSSGGTNVGAPITATDPDGDTLTYIPLGGTDGNKFEINSSTGQITVKSGTELDYETKTSYTVTTMASDGNGGESADVTITINVTDVNEPPAKPVLTLALTPSNPKGSVDLSWTVPNMTGKPAITGYSVQFRMVGSPTWKSHSHTGTSTSATVSSQVFSGREYEFQVRATNGDGTSPWSDAGKVMTAYEVHTRSVNEGAAANTNVGGAITMSLYGTTFSYSLSGTDAGKFNVNGGSGQITVKSGTTLDYETKTSYSVVVQAVGSGHIPGTYPHYVTINVNDIAGPAKPAAPTVAQNTATPKTKLDVTWTAPSSQVPGGITGYSVQYREKSATDWTSHSVTGAGTTTTISGLTGGQTYQVQVRATDAEGNSDWSDSGEARTGAANSVPTFDDGDSTTRSIDENSAAGTNIGAAITATDADGDELAYSIGGTDGDKFDMALTSPQIRVNADNIPDYDTKSSYTVTISVTDNKDADGNTDSAIDDTITVTINVTLVNVAPTFDDGDTATRSIAENSATYTNVGAAIAATDPDDADLIYSISGTDAGKFSIGIGTSQIKVEVGTTLDYETKSFYTVTLGVSDNKDESGNADSTVDDTITVTINVTDVAPPAKPERPVVTANADNPTTALDVSWTAPTSNHPDGITSYNLRYRANSAGNWIPYGAAGTGTSRTLSSLTDAVDDYEVQVRATDAEGFSPWSDSGTTAIVNINPTFDDGDTTTREIPENSAWGTKLGAKLAVTDPDDETLNFVLINSQGKHFSVDSQGFVTQAHNGFDYEANPDFSQTLRVHVHDGKDIYGNKDSSFDDYIDVVITVSDVDELPGKMTAPTVVRNADAPASSMDVSWTAPDMTGKSPITKYRLEFERISGEDLDKADKVAIEPAADATSVTVTKLRGNTKYYFQIRAENDDSILTSSEWSERTEATTAPNSPPTFDEGDSASRVIAENSAADTNIGAAVTATDADGDRLYYSLTGTDAGKFAIIDRRNGQISVGSNTTLDYETTTSYSVTVEVSDLKDAQGNHDATVDDTITVTISITDVNESPPRRRNPGGGGGPSYTPAPPLKPANQNPSFSQDATTRSVAENSAGGTKVGGTVVATDPDGDSLTYVLGGTDSGSFSINASTGQLSVAQSAILDYETKKAYTVSVGVSDRKDLQGNADNSIDDTITVTIGILDRNDLPVIINPGNKSYELGQTITNFTIEVTDQDANDTVTVSLSGLTTGLSFNGTQVSGAVSTQAVSGTYTVTITANDGVGADVTDTFQIEVTDSNGPPVITNPGNKSYRQGETITEFGIVVTDPDNDPVTVSVTSLPENLGYASGTVSGTVGAQAVTGIYVVTITANDGVNPDVTATFNITVESSGLSISSLNQEVSNIFGQDDASSPFNLGILSPETGDSPWGLLADITGGNPPSIVNPGDRRYFRGETIAPFSIVVDDPDFGDTVTTILHDLPAGLFFDDGVVQGTVSSTAKVGAQLVQITASDGSSPIASALFTILIGNPVGAPEIMAPPTKRYQQGEEIAPFSIEVIAVNPEDRLMLLVEGLPTGLYHTGGAEGVVEGTVDPDADLGSYPVKITAFDGKTVTVDKTFMVEVTAADSFPILPVLLLLMLLLLLLLLGKIIWDALRRRAAVPAPSEADMDRPVKVATESDVDQALGQTRVAVTNEAASYGRVNAARPGEARLLLGNRPPAELR